jgi:pSer/pThr/pTyr-binding forkhead associated (FHA) protein
MKKCIKCYNLVDDGEEFCSECGTKINVDTSNADVNSEQHFSENTKVQECNTLSAEKLNENATSTPTYSEIQSSDCEHFKIEWNKGASVFMTNAMSSLQFRISPLVHEAYSANDFKLFVRFPGENKFSDNNIRFSNISTSRRSVNINYKPKTGNIGANQVVDIHFSYRLNNESLCYEQQIFIDIYPDSAPSNKMLENLTIKIGEITQEGKAGDPSLNLLNGLYQNKNEYFDQLEKLKSAELWISLQLFQAIPLEDDSLKKMIIPPAPWGQFDRILIEINNKTILLFSEVITAGRSRDADLTLRNEPPEGEDWTVEKLQMMNLSINKIHCKLGIVNNKAVVEDNNSLNGTYLDNIKLNDNENRPLKYQKNNELSLASPEIYPRNITLSVRVYPSDHRLLIPDDCEGEKVPAGIVINQKGKDNLFAVIVNRWIPLSSIVPNAGNTFLTYRENFFAVTDGKKWNWLAPGLTLTINRDLMIKVLNN